MGSRLMVFASSSSHIGGYSDRILVNLRLFIVTHSVVAFLLIASCAGATVLPTPTATPTSTPTPTPAAVIGFNAGSFPSADPDWTARLTRSLSPIPSTYSPVIFLDVKAALANTVIQQAFDLEVLGLLDTLQPGASTSVDSAVVAFSSDGNGLITVIQGALDVDGLLAAASGLGLVAPGQEPEEYRGYEVRSVDVFGISLGLASVDEFTLIIATGSSTGGATGLEQIRTALDSSDGLASGLLEDPGTFNLVNELPAGVRAVVLADCGNLTALFSPNALQGCTRAAISAEVAESGSGVINAILEYEDESQASAAIDSIDREGFQLDDLTIQKVAAVQEGSLLWLRLQADLEQVAMAFDILGLP